ncbi:MAG: prolipoprotein diacylglyceryl transferase [Desulfovibrionaceae bacterium]
MHPILFEFGGFGLHTYGLLVALAFLASLWWAGVEARAAGLDAAAMPDIALWVFVGAVLGARLLYVLIDLPHFLAHPLEAVMFWRGGLVYSGGAVLGAALGIWYGRRKRLPVLPWLDAIAPAVALGQGIGRLGCLSAGCCYGAPTGAPWGVTFTSPECLAEPLGVPLHPTQLYHAAAAFGTFALLVALRGRFRTPGRRVGLYLVLFAVQRVVIEFFRADWRGDAGPLSVTQVVALAFLAAGMYLLLRRQRTRSGHA